MIRNGLAKFLARRKEKKRMKERVAIARDVIWQLKQEQYIATSGVYVDGLKPEHKGELRDVLLVHKPVCKICAIGGMFLSCIRRNDDFSLDEKSEILPADGVRQYSRLIDRHYMVNKLSAWFTDDELHQIEMLFENTSYSNGLADEIREDGERLITIMQYIIDHEGAFDCDQIIEEVGARPRARAIAEAL